MKILKTIAVVSALTATVLSTNASAGQTNFAKTDDSVETKLCYTAVTSSRVNMNKQIKYQGYRKSFVEKHLTCNNMSIGSFVAQHGSEKMQKFLPQKTKVRVIDIAANSSMAGYVDVTK